MLGNSYADWRTHEKRRNVPGERPFTVRVFAHTEDFDAESELLLRCLRRFGRMTLNALKRGNIAEVNRVLKGFVRFVTKLALVFGERTQINRMLKRPHLHRGSWIH